MIILVYGTRPEAIKLGPVAAELRALGTPFKAICTGQHTDLLRGTPVENDLIGTSSLGLASDGHVLRWLAKAQRMLEPMLVEASIVVVQGDTMSALVGARAAKAAGVPVAHVEAGIRSHADEPWPEEGFRLEIDSVADWMYAPTTRAFANLIREERSMQRIRVTGNTVVDALARYTAAKPMPPGEHCLVTLHRREWTNGPQFVSVLDGLVEAVRMHPAANFFWPMHPTVEKRVSRAWLANLPSTLTILKPLVYKDAARMLASAFGVLTDSGGIQEEAATLGVPCAVLRNVLDRPESVEAGVAARFAVTKGGVITAVEALCTGQLPRRVAPVFGEVGASSAIARHLASLVPLEVY